MARLERPTQKSSNPAQKFLEWKSNKKSFSFYDKEKGENVEVALPVKFMFLEHYHNVKGWSDSAQSGMYSNEVYAISTQPLNVKLFKGGSIASGLYKEIKEQVLRSGGKYHRSIYVVLEDGTMANLQLKGSAVAEYSEFYKNNNHLFDTKWIEINSTVDGKKGSISFSSPEFTMGSAISKADDKVAIEKAKELQEYVNNYTSDSNPSILEAEEVELPI